jgi:hypothetical protein
MNFHIGVNGGQFQWGVAFGLAGGGSLDLDWTDSGCRSTDGEIYGQAKVSLGKPLLGAGADATLAFELNDSGNARFDVNGGGTIGLTTYGGSATHIKGEGWRKPNPLVGKSFPLSSRDLQIRNGYSGFLGVGLRGAIGGSCSPSNLP